MRVAAIIPAAGRSTRMGSGGSKIFSEIQGKPLLHWTLRPFYLCETLSEIVLVGRKEEVGRIGQIASDSPIPLQVVVGGEERFDSVLAGLQACPEAELVLIHDAARPLIEKHLIEKTIQKAREFGGAVTAIPCEDTMKRTSDGETVLKTVPRQGLWRAQTPQCFQAGAFRRAYAQARDDGGLPTDDATIAERFGIPVAIVQGEKKNIKVTTPEDLEFVSLWIASLSP